MRCSSSGGLNSGNHTRLLEAFESNLIMAHQKREASASNEDWGSKRPKGADTSAENDCNVDTAASQETNGENRDTTQKESKVPTGPCISDGKSTSISKFPSQQEMILTSVEADAAEDKGCRHTMEDAWVVLPDASMESPGNLRLPLFLFILITAGSGCLLMLAHC